MAEQRTPRSSESREKRQRPSDSYVPASVLPIPEPKDGWVYRWVRTSSLGNADNTNVSQKFRDGWEPVLASDHPELEVMSDIGSRFEGNIEIGGLLLCKAPEEQMKKREEYYQQMASQQIDSVDNNFLRENDPRMPLLNPERRTRTQFGRG
ncbi:MAG: hypothetical protein NWE77_08070 [Candidatus Bathyarchaeota archaeon]|nr:hypothetical protein [Candidatus Bathyarchaeota archaeon]